MSAFHRININLATYPQFSCYTTFFHINMLMPCALYAMRHCQHICSRARISPVSLSYIRTPDGRFPFACASERKHRICVGENGENLLLNFESFRVWRIYALVRADLYEYARKQTHTIRPDTVILQEQTADNVLHVMFMHLYRLFLLIASFRLCLVSPVCVCVRVLRQKPRNSIRIRNFIISIFVCVHNLIFTFSNRMCAGNEWTNVRPHTRTYNFGSYSWHHRHRTLALYIIIMLFDILLYIICVRNTVHAVHTTQHRAYLWHNWNCPNNKSAPYNQTKKVSTTSYIHFRLMNACAVERYTQ